MEDIGVVMANSSGNKSGTGPASLIVAEATSAGKKESAYKVALSLQTAHFMPQGKPEHVFVRQTAAATRLPMPDINVWTCGSSAINRMTGDSEHVFNHQVLPIGQQLITIGDGTVKRILFVGT